MLYEKKTCPECKDTDAVRLVVPAYGPKSTGVCIRCAGKRMTVAYKRTTSRLIRCFKAQGFVIDSVYDGECEYTKKTEAEYIDHLTSVQDSYLYLTHPLTDAKAYTLMLVYGNDASELVADWSVPKDVEVNRVFELAWGKFTVDSDRLGW